MSEEEKDEEEKEEEGEEKEEKEEKGKNVGLNTGVRGGEGSEGGSLFKQPLRCAEKLTHFYPLNPAHWAVPKAVFVMEIYICT